MEPGPTLAEVARILRPGGVMAAADADWPPVAGSARAEGAWLDVDRRIARYERRMASGEDLMRPLEDEPRSGGTAGDGKADGAGGAGRAGPEDRGAGVRSWDKAGHLGRMSGSGLFAFTRELVLHGGGGSGADGGTDSGADSADGGADRFVALLRSQGGYQQVRGAGVSDDALGLPEFERAVTSGFDERPSPVPLSFCWRVRLGVAA